MVSKNDAFIAGSIFACIESLGVFIAAWLVVVKRVLDEVAQGVEVREQVQLEGERMDRSGAEREEGESRGVLPTPFMASRATMFPHRTPDSPYTNMYYSI